ncbi:uncharacterized protein Pyn_16798 [Prunus yedoensis var. nudiflora]|uniref:Uncharacterized protein n=1 Tax=Prunus yedoensis var. nudiflora TaxID=2094558 RepID=A0A314XEX7_PRUYE|nr:uncharacterized protein Pyn_16798 [Prunus yedoensis var. nudiflora]
MTPTDEVDYVDLDGDTQDLEDIHVIDDISPTSTNGQKRRNRASNSSDILPTKKIVAVKDVIADSITRMALSFEEFIRAHTKNLDPAEERNCEAQVFRCLHMEGEGSMLVKQESTYKSVFILARNARRNYQGHLFEVKIGQGSGDIMGAREGIPVPIDAQDRPPLLHPVTKFFDDEKSHTVFPYNSSLVAVTFNGPSKLYMMVTAPEPKPYLIRSTKLKPKARVFDTETKSFYKFKRPKSFGERANLIPAYGKLYHLGRCGLKEGPAFERYDPCNDCWEPLPHVPAELFRGLGMLTGTQSIWFIWGTWNFVVSALPSITVVVVVNLFGSPPSKLWTLKCGNHIKTLHSAVFDVDLTNYYIYYSFNPDCEDNEPKGEETKGPQEKRCKRKRDCTE